MPPELPQKESNELLDTACPRCSCGFATPQHYCWAICPGCGYLLKIEPYWGAISIDDVVKVALPATPKGQKVYVKKYRDGVVKIFENWRRRGLVYLHKETDPITGKVRYRYRKRSHAEMIVDETLEDDFGARVLTEEEAKEDPT